VPVEGTRKETMAEAKHFSLVGMLAEMIQRMADSVEVAAES
jgi:hypothetical protein